MKHEYLMQQREHWLSHLSPSIHAWLESLGSSDSIDPAVKEEVITLGSYYRLPECAIVPLTSFIQTQTNAILDGTGYNRYEGLMRRHEFCQRYAVAYHFS